MSDVPILHGLHHVTAVTADAPANYAFYAGLLGMRLVKKTVNQDDVSAYHLFYADEAGSPGTELTFFEWPHVLSSRPGAGTVTETALRVAGGPDALSAWRDWLARNRVPHGEIAAATAAFPASLPFRDFEGQRLRLCAFAEDASAPTSTRGALPAGLSVVGLGAVTLTVPTLERTARFLTDVLGFRADERESGVFVLGPGHPGAGLRLSESNDRGSDGAGGVHHVAWLARDHDELLSWQTRLTSFRVGNSGLIDRFYFQSLYFRIPGNILFEIATAGPGFTADGESLEHFGERLSLPPFLEGRREAIEAGLRPLDTARS